MVVGRSCPRRSLRALLETRRRVGRQCGTKVPAGQSSCRRRLVEMVSVWEPLKFVPPSVQRTEAYDETPVWGSAVAVTRNVTLRRRIRACAA